MSENLTLFLLVQWHIQIIGWLMKYNFESLLNLFAVLFDTKFNFVVWNNTIKFLKITVIYMTIHNIIEILAEYWL